MNDSSERGACRVAIILKCSLVGVKEDCWSMRYCKHLAWDSS